MLIKSNSSADKKGKRGESFSTPPLTVEDLQVLSVTDVHHTQFLQNPDFHRFVLKSMVKLYAKKALENPRTQAQAQTLLHLASRGLK